MTEPVTLLVLAGGIGKRFWPIATDKTLFPFAGKPLVSRVVGENLPEQIKKIVVVANPQSAAVYRQAKLFPLPAEVAVQEEAGGMGDALIAAGPRLGSGPVLIVIADHYLDPSAAGVCLETAGTSRAFACLTVWESPQYFPGGYVKLDGDRALGIIEKPGAGNEPGPYVSCGRYFFRSAARLVEAIKNEDNKTDDRFERAVTKLAAAEMIVISKYQGKSLSLKYPWDVLPLTELFLSEIKPFRGEGLEIRDHVVIEGPVHLGNHVRIFENTKIVGPAWIGDNTIIGNGNIIRDSMIGSGVVSGFGTDIARSYVGDNVWFHSNYIGDSVLEGDIGLGSGAVTANLRLDEAPVASVISGQKMTTGLKKMGAIIGSGARIGVNVSIMPGVKIGRGSFIGSGTILSKDVAEGSFVSTVQNQTVTQNNRQISVGDRAAFRKKI